MAEVVYNFNEPDAIRVVTSDAGGRTLKAKPPLPFWMNIEVSEGVEVVAEGVEPHLGIYLDWNAEIASLADTAQQYDIIVSPLYGSQAGFDVVEFESSNPEVCQVAPSGLPTVGVTSYQGDGTASVIVSCSVGGKTLQRESRPLTFSVTEGVTSVTPISPREGTLREDATNSIDSSIEGKYPATVAKPVFVDASWSNRNPSCWAAHIDLTCASPWNSRDAHRRAGTLVTPRHIINAAHYQLQVGDTLRFVSLGDQVVTREIIGKKVHPSYSPGFGYLFDFCTYTLDEDVPDSISFAKVLPPDYGNYLPTSIQGLPVLFLDQEEKALVADGSRLVDSAGDIRFWIEAPAEGTTRRDFFEVPISGDSGNPLFLIVDNKPVLLSVFTSSSGGSFITNSIPAINQMIEDSDLNASITPTGYTLTPCDLSGFMDFS